MDIHQLRSWIFELYEPLENERQYIVYDEQRGNLLIDAPPFSERALRLVRGAGPASLLVATKWRFHMWTWLRSANPPLVNARNRFSVDAAWWYA